MIFDDDFDPNKKIDIVPLDVELVKNNIPTYTSTKLAEMIVCSRYFGSYKDIAILCMEELAKRRIAGDTYDFESYIDQSYKTLPPIDFTMPDISDVLRQFTGKRK